MWVQPTILAPAKGFSPWARFLSEIRADMSAKGREVLILVQSAGSPLCHSCPPFRSSQDTPSPKTSAEAVTQAARKLLIPGLAGLCKTGPKQQCHLSLDQGTRREARRGLGLALPGKGFYRQSTALWQQVKHLNLKTEVPHLRRAALDVSGLSSPSERRVTPSPHWKW